MSLVSGIRSGLRSGLWSGLNPSAGDPLAGVARDATSLIYCPETVEQWETVFAVAGVPFAAPSLLWLCQDEATPLADAIGGQTGNVGAGHTFQQAVPQWARVGVKGTAGIVTSIESAAGTLPDPATDSILQITYARVDAAGGAARTIMECFGGASGRSNVGITDGGVLTGDCGGNTAVGAIDHRDANAHPWINLYNVTGGRSLMGTDLEIVEPDFTIAGPLKAYRMSRGLLTGAETTFLYSVGFFGAAAELSPSQIRAVLQTLGWAIAW